MGYHRYIKILEGNKQLAKSLGEFFKRRDKITKVEWQTNIKPLMLQAQNDILTTLKSNDLTSWGIFNLNRILSSVSVFIEKLDRDFKTNLAKSQIAISDYTVNAVDEGLKFAGLRTPMQMVQSEKLLSALIPMGEAFVDFFTNDLEKIVNAEISLGLVNNASISQVAKNIKDKFISSEMSVARAERIARTEILRASSIAQHERALEIAELNPDVRKVWISSHKVNARETHYEAELRYTTNPIPVDQPFVVDGETGMFPRDYSFSPGNSINCGCTMVLINNSELEGIKSLSKGAV